MRFVVVAGLLCALMVGLGYTYGQDSSVPTFLTAAVERGSISTLVKASGTVEAVVSVDVSSQLSGRIAEVFVNFNDTRNGWAADCPNRSGDLCRPRQ